MRTQRPLLSIGIIFKNEIRCLERCVKSLQPLRDSIPCELVMADTGSDDGSREVAEQYADILFDFPWINDFAAARNAVMDHCSGIWYLSIDADEWLCDETDEIIRALRNKKIKENVMALTIRNYDTPDMNRSFSDFVAARILRMSTGLRYEGAIHERWGFHGDVAMYFLGKTVFHHDGYAYASRSKMLEKARRNIELLRKELEDKPDDLIIRLQYMESGKNEPDYEEVLRGSLKLIDGKPLSWKNIGPPIYRYAVECACNNNLPELDEWLQRAEELFPDSVYIRIDAEYLMFCRVFLKDKFKEAIERGERYLKAAANIKKGVDNLKAQMYSVIKYASPFWQQHVKILLAAAYASEGSTFERIPDLLEGLDYTLMEESQLSNVLKVLKVSQTKSDMDTAAFITEVWDGINIPEPSPERAEQRKQYFLNFAAPHLSAKYRQKELEAGDLLRHAYTLFAPLDGKCELGRAAVVLDIDDSAVLTGKLSEVEDWSAFHIQALAHAIECGAVFPLPGRVLPLEEMDALAARMSGDNDVAISLALHSAKQDYTERWDGLVWARGIVLAAVRACKWEEKTSDNPDTPDNPDTEQKFRLADAFAAIEGQFIPRCYAPDMLRDDAIFALPSLHRFGWYCARAFEALHNGNAAEYVHLLRAGLESSNEMKTMVEFLLEHTPQLQTQPEPSAELLALAEQVKAVLANFEPDNPAVAALKQSDAYKKVAYIIEGAQVPILGGLPQ